MSETTEALRGRIKTALTAEGERDEVLGRICTLLKENLDGYDWVGFYLVDPARPRELQLGPFAGADTDHRRIPFGRGICGQVAESEQTMVVEDVQAADNYLSCSVDVRSEIVVPILVDGCFLGQLDIDSHAAARFGPEDRRLCEWICARLAEGKLFRSDSH
jgi:L-methionine (R)-S-oxide reductase